MYSLFFSRLYKFQGRSSRKEYISRFLLTTIVFLTWGYTIDYIPNNGLFALIYTLSLFFCMIIMFFQFIPLSVRRFHDINCNGWWTLLFILPFTQIIILWLMFRKGTSGANSYGEEPT
jgi:uncharacterized membrane protein YhaH (DUF805 family)